MKVQKSAGYTNTFEALTPGDVFMFGGNVYVKTEESAPFGGNTMRARDGQMEQFDPDAPVILLDNAVLLTGNARKTVYDDPKPQTKGDK